MESHFAKCNARQSYPLCGICLQILDTFKDWQFFYGESGLDGGGMVALMNFREDGVTPYMVFFKDGVVEEKVVSVRCVFRSSLLYCMYMYQFALCVC